MDLIVYQMVQLQVVHMADRDRRIKVFSASAVPQPDLSVFCDRNTFPYLAVISVVIQILHHFRQYQVLIFCFKLFPLRIDIVVSHLQSVFYINFLRSVKHRRRHIKTKHLRRQRQMDLQYLSHIHTGRNAQRI